MIYAICKGKLVTDVVVQLEQGEPLQVLLFAPRGFRKGSRIVLHESSDEILKETRRTLREPDDTEPLLGGLEISFQEEGEGRPRCVLFEWKEGFQNIGTRAIEVTELWGDVSRIKHAPLQFDVTMKIGPIEKQLSPFFKGMLYTTMAAAALITTGLIFYWLGGQSTEPQIASTGSPVVVAINASAPPPLRVIAGPPSVVPEPSPEPASRPETNRLASNQPTQPTDEVTKAFGKAKLPTNTNERKAAPKPPKPEEFKPEPGVVYYR